MRCQGEGRQQDTVPGETLSQCAADEPLLAGTPSSGDWSGRVWGACGVPTNPMLTGTAPLGRLGARAEFLRLPSESRFEFW